MKYVEPWEPFPHTFANSVNARDPAALLVVLKQFEVATNPRFTPRDLNADGTQETFCNVFTSDFTLAMSKPIPHTVDANGNPVPLRDPVTGKRNRKAIELTANATARWLERHGARHGWRPCTELAARENANQGRPTVAVWEHHGGIGHIAPVIPGPAGQTTIAQAGAVCFESGPLKRGFGNIVPKFYAAL